MRSEHKKRNPIRAARERVGLTRERTAVMAGLSLSTLYLAEKGLVTAATAAKLAPILGVPADQLARTGS